MPPTTQLKLDVDNMADSTRKTRGDKPSKSFPLFACGNGQWAKKIEGQQYYFGTWADPYAALREWEYQKDSILLTGEKRP
jgi:hypothetical protein